jgi:hypothetical protein
MGRRPSFLLLRNTRERSTVISFETTLAILDSINHPLVFVDTGHIIRHLNRPAEKKYYEQRGLSDLVGKSIFDCHAPTSRTKIVELHARLQAGEDEIFMDVNDQNERITMIAVRDRKRNLLGYYERFEKSGAAQAKAPA